MRKVQKQDISIKAKYKLFSEYWRNLVFSTQAEWIMKTVKKYPPERQSERVMC